MPDHVFLVIWCLLLLGGVVVLVAQVLRAMRVLRGTVWLRCPVCGGWFDQAKAGNEMYLRGDTWMHVCRDPECQAFVWRRNWVNDDVPDPAPGPVVELADLRASLGDVPLAKVRFTPEGGVVGDVPVEPVELEEL